MKFLLTQASDDTRREIMELTTLEQLLEIVVAEGRQETYAPAVIVEKITLPYEKFPGIEWMITIYDGWLE